MNFFGHDVSAGEIVNFIVLIAGFVFLLGQYKSRFEKLEKEQTKILAQLDTLHSDHLGFVRSLGETNGTIKGRDDVYKERFDAVRNDLLRLDRELGQWQHAVASWVAREAPQHRLPPGE